MMKTIYSRAPVRIGLIGGGTDLSEFCDHHTGHIINCTIKLYNHVYLEVIPSQSFELQMSNLNTGDYLTITDINDKNVPSFLIFISSCIKYFHSKYKINLKNKFKVVLEIDFFDGRGLLVLAIYDSTMILIF